MSIHSLIYNDMLRCYFIYKKDAFYYDLYIYIYYIYVVYTDRNSITQKGGNDFVSFGLLFCSFYQNFTNYHIIKSHWAFTVFPSFVIRI